MRLAAVISAFLATSAGVPSLIAQERHCAAATTPKALPAPSALVDSAGVLAAVGEGIAASEEMMFSLLFTPTDSFPIARPVGASYARAAEVLSRHVRPQPPNDFWAVRVRVVAGATPALTLERAVYCPAEPTPESYIPLRGLFEIRTGDQMPSRNRRLSLVLEIAVDETGYPTTVRMIRGTGMREFDAELVRQWERRRFLPALLDGTPIPSVFRTDGRAIVK